MIETLIQNLVDALNRNTAALTGEPVVPGANAAPEAAPKPRRGRPPAGGHAAEAASPEPVAAVPTPAVASVVAVSPAPAAPTATPAAPDQPTFKQVADKLIAVAEGVSRDAAVGLLAKYCAQRAPDVKVEHYAAFITDATALIAAKNAAPPSAGAGLI
jgi:hypothetical protein